MIHDPIHRDRPYHPFGCHCARCTPPTPAETRHFDFNAWARFTLAGWAIGGILIGGLTVTGLGPKLFHALGIL